MQKMEIIQWGKERSLVSIIDTETSIVNMVFINNDYLMFLDELGVII